MATLSVYPVNRGKSNGGVVLRLKHEDIQPIVAAHGPNFTNQLYVLRGTIKPFKAELRPDPFGTKLTNHGENRLQFNGRYKDLYPLKPGDDLKITNLKVRIEPDGAIMVMETTDTVYGATSARQPRIKKSSGPTIKAMAKTLKKPEEGVVGTLDMSDFVVAKDLFNKLLDEHGAELVELAVVDGRIQSMRIRRPE